jgi:glycosyltransferase involved in cell wall biosynthesis
VLPVYNESAVLRRLVDAVTASLDRTGCRQEIVFVNDGSSDGSEQIRPPCTPESRMRRAMP